MTMPMRAEPASPKALFGRLHPAFSDWFRKTHGTFSDIQLRAIPSLLDGRDTLVSSPTGTGKTLAAFAAVFDHLARSASNDGLPDGVVAVYVSPLRALAYDLEKNIRPPAEAILPGRIRIGIRSGDTPPAERARQKKKPPHILLTTPESLFLLVIQPALADILSRCRYVIIDELHSLLESKRGTQLLCALAWLEHLRRTRRPHEPPLVRAGLSATIRPVDQAAAFLTGPGRPCRLAEAASERPMIIEVLSPLHGQAYPAAGYTGQRMMRELAALVRTKRSVLVFCNTRGGAERTGLLLKQRLPEWADRIEIHHGSLDRSVRLDVEDRLKKGELRAVVCSTSLELGIDIGAVDLVVMVSAPKGVSRTLQRIGRSGHSLHETSHGILLATNVHDLAECAVTARMARALELDPVRIPAQPLDVLAQFVTALAFQREWTRAELLAFLRTLLPYQNLTPEELDGMLLYLSGGGRCLAAQYRDQFGRLTDENGIVRAGPPGAWRCLLMNAGTIPTEGRLVVRLGRKKLGTVEEAFVKRLKPGDLFVLGGEVVELLETGITEIRVAPGRGRLPTVPSWNAQKMPLSSGLARETSNLRRDLADRLGDPEAAVEWLIETFHLSRANSQALVDQFTLQATLSVIPVPGTLLVETVREKDRAHLFFHTLIGRSANDALSRLAGRRLQRERGGGITVTVDDYGFLLTVETDRVPDPSFWPRCFQAERAMEDLLGALHESDLVRWHFRGAAQTGLMVPRQTTAGPRRPKQLQWNADILFSVLREHEPDHPLMREARRDALERFLDAPRMLAFLEEARTHRWIFRDLPCISPFGFPLYASRIQEGLAEEDRDAALERIYRAMYDGAAALTTP